MIGMNNSSSNNVVNRMLCRVDHTGRLLQSTDSRRAGRAGLVILRVFERQDRTNNEYTTLRFKQSAVVAGQVFVQPRRDFGNSKSSNGKEDGKPRPPCK